jgi:hypothetical protein
MPAEIRIKIIDRTGKKKKKNGDIKKYPKDREIIFPNPEKGIF